MTAYLLDQLPEAERARLEERYIEDDALYEELKVVETELIDSYVRGGLAESDRERFEERYLASAPPRERVAFARQLAAQAAERRAGRMPADERRWRWLSAESWHASPAFAIALAAVLLVAAASLIWRLSTPTARPNPIQARREAPASAPAPPEAGAAAQVPAAKPQTPGPTGASGPVIALVLLPGSVRSPGADAVLRVPKGSTTIGIRVEHEGASAAAYRAVISTPEGREVWIGTGLTPLRPGAPSVVVDVPAHVLLPGDYILALSAGAAGVPFQAVGEYAFRVSRQ